MRSYVWTLLLAAAAAGLAGPVGAQGTTTAAISGRVTQDGTEPVADAQVQVRNNATGYSTGAVTRADGRFYVQGLEVGGPYTVTARRIGLEPASRQNITLTLGQNYRLDLDLRGVATTLSQVTVTAEEARDFNPARQGVATTVDDTLLRRIPTLSRDYTDFVKLTPQVSQPTTDAPSANGAYNRLNNYTVDGANQNDRFNLGSSEGVPGGATNGRSVSIEAIKEFQVLLSPTDVRYGNFGGMLVNAVTKSGTNEFHGGATYAFRNPDLAANEDFIERGNLQVKQYGFQLGGPIIRDKLHFYLAPEWQQRTSPAFGQSFDSPAGTTGLITQQTYDAIRNALASDFDVGGVNSVTNDNPTITALGRLDFQVTSNTRLVLRQLWNTAEQDEFSRNANGFTNRANVQNAGFRLTSNSFIRENQNYSTALQGYTNFGNGGSNEFIAGYNIIRDKRIVPVTTPEISIGATYVGSTTANTGVVTVGTEQFSPGNDLKQRIFELADNYSIPFGAHTVTVGARFEDTYIYNNFAQRSGGVWTFADTTALKNRTPTSYSLGYSNGGKIPAELTAQQFSLYAQDQWAMTPNLTLSYGLRADLPRFLDTPVANPFLSAIADTTAVAGLNTAQAPKSQVLWSPRVGFNWNPGGEARNQVRGNIGIYTSPPPLILLANAYQNTGMGLVTLFCDGSATARVPTFTTGPDQPRACGGQTEPPAGRAGTAGINTTNRDFKYPQTLGLSAGFDRQLPWGVVFTFEGLYRKAINGLVVTDRNLFRPHLVGTAPYVSSEGRVIYADTMTFSATGGATVNLNGARAIDRAGNPPTVNFTEGIIEVTNQSKDYNWSLSGQLRKRFSAGLELGGAYTFMQSKDVQSLTSDRAISNWRNGRQFAGLENDWTATTSYFERPHRLIGYGTYTLPWQSTDISFYYEGMSGTPLTYTANGDLNGDGTSGNDPIYIPRNATDASEVRIGTGSGTAFALDATRAQAFEDFIRSQDCLSDQRGRIMERNSCTSPWQNRMDVSVRQSLPWRGQALTVQLDIVNFLNLLNNDWGQIELPSFNANFPQQNVLQPVGITPGPIGENNAAGVPGAKFNYLFDPTNATGAGNGAFYARQDDIRNFYQMQLTFRYSF
ncbi:MAG TPA: carboxypeptidase regulatory-like domain-containing protein [Gemmatimonadaceae bacterium]|nr:carboxypeptidase regulatory-like domain-containing protein [Gemmatimonadaceae bacterium]